MEKVELTYYSVAANTTGRMAQLAAGATPPAWDALERGLGELRGALSEDLSRFFRDEARWAPSEARQELAKWFLKKVHGATTGVVDELRQGGVVVQPS